MSARLRLLAGLVAVTLGVVPVTSVMCLTACSEPAYQSRDGQANVSESGHPGCHAAQTARTVKPDTAAVFAAHRCPDHAGAVIARPRAQFSSSRIIFAALLLGTRTARAGTGDCAHTGDPPLISASPPPAAPAILRI